MIDKLRIVLCVTWVWAWVGLQITKSFEYAFRLMLKMPNNWLDIPAQTLAKTLIGSDGKVLNIISACNEEGNITNKLKIFLSWYWQDAKKSDLEKSGFYFKTFAKLLNCSILYCSYLVVDESLDPDEFWKDIRRFLVVQEEKQTTRSLNTDLSDAERLSFGYVSF